jgi:CO/xanthine dehydrogenase FAD-binding subunit
MYPKAIEPYFAPTTVDAAFRLLAEHRDSATLLARGQSLMPTLKLRLVEPGCLIDLNRIPVLGRCERPMIAIGGLPARPACARQAAALLAGTVLDDAACARAGEMAAGEVAWQTASARASASGSAPHVGAPVTIRFPSLPPQLETLFSEASETALVSCFTADML